MKINIETKFDYGDMVTHKTNPGTPVVIVRIFILPDGNYQYGTHSFDGVEANLNYFFEFELEKYEKGIGFKL